MKRKKLASTMKWPMLLLMISINSLATFSQDMDNLNNPVPLDPQVRMGKLLNGLTYYIRENDRPANKIEMQFVVKAGAFHEDEDQLEYAHLTEHMAFEGTKNFPGDSMLNYTAKHGMNFGNEITAGTAAIDTHYDLSIPADNPELFQNSLRILRDWVQNFLFDANRVNSQRGAVLGEMRAQGVLGEMTSLMKQKVLNNDYYAPGYIKAREESIRHGKYASLVRFYNDWYRPDLQAIIIVGAIDVERTEDSIRTLFADVKPQHRTRKVSDVVTSRAGQLTGKNQYIILTHSKGLEGIDLYLYLKQKGGTVLKNHQDYRQSIIESLFNNIIAKRMRVLHDRYNLPFKGVHTLFQRDIFHPLTQIDGVIVNIDLDHAELIQTAFKDVMSALERVKRDGFIEEELSQAKEKFKSDIKTHDRSSSINILRKYRDHFVHGKAAPSSEYEEWLISTQLEDIGLDELNMFAKKRIDFDHNRDVIILGSEKDKPKLPKRAAIDKWLKEVKETRMLPPYQLNKRLVSLMSDKELPLSIDEMSFHENKNEKTGITELLLKNGVKIVMYSPPKQFFTTRKSGEIELLAYSHGGSSLYHGVDRATAESASHIVFHSGVKQFDKFQLDNYLRNRNVTVHPSIGSTHEQISGACPTEGVETMLQMVYLYFTAPRKDECAFKDWKSTSMAAIKRNKALPTSIFFNFIDSLTQDKIGVSSEQLSQISLDNAYRLYNERFSNAGDFTFFVTGNFNTPKVKQLFVKYLGNLPADRKQDERLAPSHFSAGKINETVYTNISEKKCDIRLYFPGEATYEYTIKNYLILQILGRALSHKILDRLRTQEGGAYTPTAVVQNTRLSKNEGTYRFLVSFDCEPDNTENMIRYALEEFGKLRKDGPDQDTYLKSKAFVYETTAGYLQKGISARRNLKDFYLYNESPNEYFNQLKILDQITHQEIIEAAKRYVSDENYQRFVNRSKEL